MDRLYGLLGEKLGHSFSPQIHSLIFEELKIRGNYSLFEVQKKSLEGAVEGFKESGIKGINVTIPYKVDVMKYLDCISKEAEKIGAVNTIDFKENKLFGYNTDYYGFGMMLNKFNVQIKDKIAVILGTGGASKSVIHYLLDNEIGDVVIVTRDLEKVDNYFRRFKLINYKKLDDLKNGDIIINCTPCGMHPNIENCPVSKNLISNFDTAIDLIYNPRKTLFLKYAAENNLKAINGLYMLVGQAIKAQEIWNNVNINQKIVDNIYKKIETII